MAKILYGVAGEGSGHSSRAKVIIEHLLNNGHEVKVVSHDRGYANLKPYFDVEKIFGLRFVYRNNEVKSFETVLRNISKFPQALKSIKKVSRIVKKFKPQIVLSDFEPICGIVANENNLPLVSIDNQHVFTNTKISYPKKYQQDYLTAKAVIKLILRNTKASLVTTFFNGKIRKDNTFVFPPILRNEVLKLKPTNNDYVLVYLTSEFKGLLDILKKINKKFVIYGFDINKRDGNLFFKKASQKGFLNDLANCHGVLANAGFSLMSEALYFKKPYLAVPLKKQFEQILNAYYLDKLGYGKYWDELNQERIEAFLFNLDLYSKNLKKYKKEDNIKILKKVDELIG